MSRLPHLKAFLVFAAYASIGLFIFMKAATPLMAWGGFALCGVIGMVFSSRIFDRNASVAEKRADLEERNRNSPY